jgi:hypothetical protein
MVLLPPEATLRPAFITDEFAQNTLGLQIGKVFGPLHIVGLGVATACVISGL